MSEAQKRKNEDKFKELSEAYDRLQEWIRERDDVLDSKIKRGDVDNVSY